MYEGINSIDYVDHRKHITFCPAFIIMPLSGVLRIEPLSSSTSMHIHRHLGIPCCKPSTFTNCATALEETWRIMVRFYSCVSSPRARPRRGFFHPFTFLWYRIRLICGTLRFRCVDYYSWRNNTVENGDSERLVHTALFPYLLTLTYSITLHPPPQQSHKSVSKQLRPYVSSERGVGNIWSVNTYRCVCPL